jgi:hypothetical protein
MILSVDTRGRTTEPGISPPSAILIDHVLRRARRRDGDHSGKQGENEIEHQSTRESDARSGEMTPGTR